MKLEPNQPGYSLVTSMLPQTITADRSVAGVLDGVHNISHYCTTLEKSYVKMLLYSQYAWTVITCLRNNY